MNIKKDLAKGIPIGVGAALAGITILIVMALAFSSPLSQKSVAPTPSSRTDLTKEKEAASPSESTTVDTSKQATAKRLVVKNKSLELEMEVDNTPKAYRKVEKITASYNGYIAYSTTSTEDQSYLTFTEEQKIPLDLSPSSAQRKAASTGSKIATISEGPCQKIKSS